MTFFILFSHNINQFYKRNHIINKHCENLHCEKKIYETNSFDDEMEDFVIGILCL